MSPSFWHGLGGLSQLALQWGRARMTHLDWADKEDIQAAATRRLRVPVKTMKARSFQVGRHAEGRKANDDWSWPSGSLMHFRRQPSCRCARAQDFRGAASRQANGGSHSQESPAMRLQTITGNALIILPAGLASNPSSAPVRNRRSTTGATDRSRSSVLLGPGAIDGVFLVAREGLSEVQASALFLAWRG